MKIGLITIHYANSYGGNLQAYSTQQTLSKYGDVKIIDYRSPGLSKTMCLIRTGTKPRDLLRMGKDLFRLFPRRRLLKKFIEFGRLHFKLTGTFTDPSQLPRLDNEFDVLVTGSDQIWNPAVVGAFDPAYLLGFAAKAKKISFASSAGSYRFSSVEQETLKEHLGRFTHVAVREDDTACFLSQLLGRAVTHVLDPTLMLTRSEWLESLRLPEPESSAPYILVYTLKKDQLVKDAVNTIAARLKLKVIAIDQDPFLGYRADRHLRDASPLDFVALISRAAFVVTSSFHGTTFAVNFQIPFISIKPETGLNRIAGFLESVKLRDRLVMQLEDLDRVLESQCRFEEAQQALDSLREASYRYLDDALGSGASAASHAA